MFWMWAKRQSDRSCGDSRRARPRESRGRSERRLLAAERFSPNGSTSAPSATKTPRPTKETVPASEPETVINAPLDFTLKVLDRNHPYLAARGFTPETIDHFGLGFCSKGLMKDRIAIPLFDPVARLIGYAGRVVDDSLIGEDNPKYRFPGDRERNGKRYAFEKSRFVYNGHHITTPVSDLVVVEGFASVWWMFQNNQPNVVALMGASCSEHQADEIIRLVKPDGRIWILTDGDEAGERCAAGALPLLAAERLTRWHKLDPGKQPTDLHTEAVRQLWNI